MNIKSYLIFLICYISIILSGCKEKIIEENKFSSGKGTVDNPYIIASAEELEFQTLKINAINQHFSRMFLIIA